MNFDDAFKHYREGSATEEEIAFVKEEIAKARALSSLFDDEPVAVKPAQIVEADVQEVKAVKKKFKIKYLGYAFGAVMTVMLAIGAILGGVFGSAASFAKKQISIDRTVAANLAIQALSQKTSLAVTDIYVDDIDLDFNYETPLQESFYIYVIELESRQGDYKVYLDTRDGSVIRICHD